MDSGVGGQPGGVGGQPVAGLEYLDDVAERLVDPGAEPGPGGGVAVVQRRQQVLRRRVGVGLHAATAAGKRAAKHPAGPATPSRADRVDCPPIRAANQGEAPV